MSSDGIGGTTAARWRTSAAGATAAGLVAALSLLAGIGYLSLPGDQRPFRPLDLVFSSVSDGVVALPALLWVLAMQGLAGLGAVLVISRRVAAATEAEDWGRWATAVGLLGFGVMTVAAVAAVERLPLLADLYDAKGFPEGDVIGAAWPPLMEPGGLLFCGAAGVWVLWASVMSLRGAVGPRSMAIIGLVLAASLLVAAVGAAGADGRLWATMTAFATIAGTAWFALWARELVRDEP